MPRKEASLTRKAAIQVVCARRAGTRFGGAACDDAQLQCAAAAVAASAQGTAQCEAVRAGNRKADQSSAAHDVGRSGPFRSMQTRNPSAGGRRLQNAGALAQGQPCRHTCSGAHACEWVVADEGVVVQYFEQP
jgi:hypothetical protein